MLPRHLTRPGLVGVSGVQEPEACWAEVVLTDLPPNDSGEMRLWPEWCGPLMMQHLL